MQASAWGLKEFGEDRKLSDIAEQLHKVSVFAYEFATYSEIENYEVVQKIQLTLQSLFRKLLFVQIMLCHISTNRCLNCVVMVII